MNKKIIEKVIDDEKGNDKIIKLLNMSFSEWIDIFTMKKNLDEYNLERIIFESNFSTPDLPKYWDKLLNLAFIYTQLKFRPYI